MQVKTWLHRLTDEQNTWFSAIKAEDEDRLTDAAFYYLKDAQEWVDHGSIVRVALSCSCAANCLANMGAWPHARKLYLESANIYVKNSEVVMGESIREALWSLEEAFENYLLAGENHLAEIISDRYVKLAARTNPFSKKEQAIKELESRKNAIDLVLVSKSSKKDAAIPDKLTKEIETFLKTEKSLVKGSAGESNSADVLKSIAGNGGSKLNEKSIIS
jgi:hypothetical protein